MIQNWGIIMTKSEQTIICTTREMNTCEYEDRLIFVERKCCPPFERKVQFCYLYKFLDKFTIKHKRIKMECDRQEQLLSDWSAAPVIVLFFHLKCISFQHVLLLCWIAKVKSFVWFWLKQLTYKIRTLRFILCNITQINLYDNVSDKNVQKQKTLFITTIYFITILDRNELRASVLTEYQCTLIQKPIRSWDRKAQLISKYVLL
jgi:hypothetical protein